MSSAAATAATDDLPLEALPPVSVIMAVYNGERFLSDAIESILNQTHRDLDVVIVDDGSRDLTPQILADWAARDPRLRYVSQANTDQPTALNNALALAKHEWVAVTDHDDRSAPTRIEATLRLALANPTARVISTWASEIDATGRVIGYRNLGPTTEDAFLRARAVDRLLYLVHPSVLFHGPTVRALGGYRREFGAAADTDLWSRVADEHTILSVPQHLLDYRVHLRSMSFDRYDEQRLRMREILLRQRARRSGRPEPTREEALEEIRTSALTARVQDARIDRAEFLLRRARLEHLAGQRVRGGVHLGQAFAMTPLRSAKRLRGFLKRQKRHDISIV